MFVHREACTPEAANRSGIFGLVIRFHLYSFSSVYGLDRLTELTV